jgi:hypothetical protein
MMAISTNTPAAIPEGRRATRSRLSRGLRCAGGVALVTGGVAGLLVMSAGASIAAPTCSDALDIAVHGKHVVGDYVTGIGRDVLVWPPAGQVGTAIPDDGPAYPGGPGPGYHFVYGYAPGASFCLSQSNSPGWPHDG